MSAKILPFPTREFDLNEFLFGSGPLSIDQRRALAYALNDAALTDAVEDLAAARWRLGDALASMAQALNEFADALEAHISGGAK